MEAIYSRAEVGGAGGGGKCPQGRRGAGGGSNTRTKQGKGQAIIAGGGGSAWVDSGGGRTVCVLGREVSTQGSRDATPCARALPRACFGATTEPLHNHDTEASSSVDSTTV